MTTEAEMSIFQYCMLVYGLHEQCAKALDFLFVLIIDAPQRIARWCLGVLLLFDLVCVHSSDLAKCEQSPLRLQHAGR